MHQLKNHVQVYIVLLLIYFIQVIFFLDMEWLNGPSETENMEVDIGYMPQMMANITDKSRRPRHPHELSGEVPVEVNNQLMESLQNIEWTEEIPQEDALRDLEVKMYPFKQVCQCSEFLFFLNSF